ncbi:pyruvate kinase [Jiulongibacter sediminis]|jgi:pyruvate kinase|uniref:Pyruvate kinase n=1 Tax=Jiulongibacter sediminis TaxID=1605367 RepID=A0A0P7C3B1_9BACT|nr:pyruvate kinase [Jiulongibacter sediminis]KPM48752.1 pyruvate kinase [Jiulongibacter sediminis]TBX25286.1 pyruvate kinase [Jiulongibacter sediminis]
MYKKTKIVATVGPVSESEEMLLKLANAGVNVFRLNFSHGDHAEHLARLERIRKINKEHNLKCAILQDLQGPKIRVGQVEGGNAGVELIPGNKFVFSNEDIVGNAERVSTPYKGMYQDVKVGERILMDDGKLEVKVVDVDAEKQEVITEVVYGGLLKQKKGVNLPNTNISQPSVTDKDWKDLEFGLEHDVDWIALSFVRTAEEIIKIKEYIKSKGSSAKVIAKIEKPEAITNMDSIIEAVDGIMVARGDLGVEMPGEEVPLIQKELVRKCNMAAKPVIVATQMLESMVDNPRATRAEIGDVANAVFDGADAVMLSGESAAGKYPVLAVETMAKTVREVEQKADEIYFKYHTEVTKPGYVSDDKDNDNVIVMGCRLARDLDVKAIIGYTSSGYTAVRLSHHRPKANVYIFTSNPKLLTQLSLYSGVEVISSERMPENHEGNLVDAARDFLIAEGKLEKGDKFINTLSVPLQADNRTNTVRLSVVD